MKFPRILLTTLFASASVSCSPLNSPGDLFATGRDGRSYNATTGRFEWPEAETPARPRNGARQVSPTLQESASPAPDSDGRAYSLEKGRYEWSDSGVPRGGAASQP